MTPAALKIIHDEHAALAVMLRAGLDGIDQKVERDTTPEADIGHSRSRGQPGSRHCYPC